MSIYNSLKRIVKSNDIEIEEISGFYNYGAFNPTLNRIHVSVIKNKYYSNIILAHEFGHYLAFLNKNEKSISYLENLYNKILFVKLSSKQKLIILKEERIAWRNARKILKKLGFKNWQVFNKFKKSCLSEYERL